MMPPAHRFTHAKVCGLIFPCIKPVTLLNIVHHIMDPQNTPAIISAAEPDAPLIPTPAKIPANARIVIGFVSVRKNTDAYALSGRAQ